jgi:hypothetical protein
MQKSSCTKLETGFWLVPFQQVNQINNMEITQYILFILMTVESGGNMNAVGDDGKAFGLYQLHAAYVQDAEDHRRKLGPPCLVGMPWHHQDAFLPHKSALIVKTYMARYATEERIGRPVTVEDICRIHNGGPNGYKKSCTDAYWAKCKKVIEDNNLWEKVK